MAFPKTFGNPVYNGHLLPNICQACQGTGHSSEAGAEVSKACTEEREGGAWNESNSHMLGLF
jgi:hypothetical protein